MKTKRNFRAPAKLRLLIVLPLITIAMFAVTSCGKTVNPEPLQKISEPPQPAAIEEKTKTEPYSVVEEMPVFPGGDSALLKYIAENTVYPDSAKLKNTQGRVIARFVIDIDGSVKMASIIKGVGPYLDEEALRVVNSLPRFSPGKQAGKEVPVWYMVPISFQLK